MKTNTFNYLKLALMAVLMINLTSCEVEIDSFYDDDDNNGGGYYNRSAELCSRTWEDNYRDVDNNYCTQQLDFYLDRTGVNFLRVEYRNGTVETFEYHFRWNWDNYGQTNIRMDYGHADISFFDNVYIGGNRLSGYLDGKDNYVEFKGI